MDDITPALYSDSTTETSDQGAVRYCITSDNLSDVFSDIYAILPLIVIEKVLGFVGGFNGFSRVNGPTIQRLQIRSNDPLSYDHHLSHMLTMLSMSGGVDDSYTG